MIPKGEMNRGEGEDRVTDTEDGDVREAKQSKLNTRPHCSHPLTGVRFARQA